MSFAFRTTGVSHQTDEPAYLTLGFQDWNLLPLHRTVQWAGMKTSAQWSPVTVLQQPSILILPAALSSASGPSSIGFGPSLLCHQPESGTAKTEDFTAITEAVASLIESAAPDELEDGADTPLIPGLYRVIREHGVGAVMELAGRIASDSIDPYVASWMLRWLGRIPHGQSYRASRWLLERSLQSPVPVIRDGAVLGLASLRDAKTLPALRAAAAREPYRRLRTELEKTIRQLERIV